MQIWDKKPQLAKKLSLKIQIDTQNEMKIKIIWENKKDIK